jgi:hypothetical protein
MRQFRGGFNDLLGGIAGFAGIPVRPITAVRMMTKGSRLRGGWIS